METKTIYIAFDGREFEDDTECYEYEMDKQLLSVHNDLIMRDADGNEIGMNQFGDCYYLACKTQAAAEVVWDWGYEYQGYDIPWYGKKRVKPGNYFYDTNTEKWYDADEEIKKLEERLSFLRKIMGENEELLTVPKWISVEEQLPETGKVVLLCINCEKSRPHTGFLTVDGGFVHDVLGDMSRSKWKVTHWMSLPEPPTEME